VRFQTLLKQNSIARQQAEDQASIVKQDEGTVETDQALIDAQALNIAYCHIIAPVTGRVGLRLVDLMCRCRTPTGWWCGMCGLARLYR
jgi:membrane fusion protein, multidrug efflux system